MKTRHSTEYVLLGALMSGPKHGYEIMQFIEIVLGSTWRVGTSQLYALLKKLEKNGLVNSSFKTQETRPSKRVFTMTPAGRKKFLKWVHSPTENVRDIRMEFLAKLFFMQQLRLEEGEDLIKGQTEMLIQTKKKLQQSYESEKNPYRKLVLDFKMATVKTWLEWIRRKARYFVK